jgi:hypothetical protein
MRVFISGLNFDQAESRFEAAEAYLISIGVKVINPIKNELLRSENWEKRILRKIELLFGCDAIFLLNEWQSSTEARIEKHIAEDCSKTILLESKGTAAQTERIKDAIFEVTGLKFDQYNTECKKREIYFARLLFVHCCQKYENMQPAIIEDLINRNVNRYPGKFNDEVRLNKAFRLLVESVEEILSKLYHCNTLTD